MKLKLDYILIIALLVMSFFLFRTCSHVDDLERDTIISSQNLIAKSDSLKELINENGDISYEKASLILSNKELKTQNKKLYKNNEEFIKHIKKMDRKLISIAQIVGEINGVGGTGDGGVSEKINDSTYLYPIQYDANNLKLDGDYAVKMKDNKLGAGLFTINSWHTQIGLTTAVTEDKDGILRFHVKPKDESIVITDVNSTIFDPKDSKLYKSLLRPKRITFGPTLSTGVMINPVTGNGGLYIGIGLGVTYRVEMKDIKKIFLND